MESNRRDVAASHDEVGAVELRDLIARLAGIGDVEVDLREDGTPHLRIWLDGSVPADEVGAEVREMVASTRSGNKGAAAIADAEPSRTRRTGLGKDLGELLTANGDTSAPSLLIPASAESAQSPKKGLALVAVEETAGGISVRAADSGGGIAFSPVEDPRSLNQAIVSAVARLHQERPLPRLAGVEIRDVDGSPVLTVVLAFSGGRRSVGAALVDGGMPFTLGRAVWEAFAALD